MILDRDSFFTLEKIVNETPDLEYVFINFDFMEKDGKVVFDKQFIPVLKEDLVHSDVINNILSMSLSMMVYSAKSYEKNKSEYITDIVFDVLERRVSDDMLIQIDNNLDSKGVDCSSSEVIEDNSDLLDIISKSFIAMKYFKDIRAELSNLDDNFLSEEQIIKIVKEFDSLEYDGEVFDEHKYNSLTFEEQDEYIKNIYMQIESSYIPMLDLAYKNVKSILKKLKLEKELWSIFFDEDDYLNMTQEKFKLDDNCLGMTYKEVFENEYYQVIYKAIKDKDLEYYPNALRYFMEIQREVKYLNLYELNTLQDMYVHSDILSRLYENMTKNVLTNVLVNDYETFLSSINDLYLEIINQECYIEEHHREAMEAELLNYYNGNIEDYEDSLSNDYINIIYGADNNGVTMDDVLNYRIRCDIEPVRKQFINKNYHLQMLLIENYLQSENTITKEKEKELEEKIPTTKLVLGKRKRLTKKERQTHLKANKKTYLMDLKLTIEEARKYKHEVSNKTIANYSRSIYESLEFQKEIAVDTASFFSEAKAKGIDEWDAVLNDETIDYDKIERANEINKARKDFNSLNDEIKREQNQAKKDTKNTKDDSKIVLMNF